MIVWLLLLAHGLGLLSSVTALMTARTPQGTIAWVLSLNLFPYVAVPAFWVFGRSRFHGYVAARKLRNRALTEDGARIRQHLAPLAVAMPGERDRLHALERLAGWPLLGHNAAELLIDGPATFESVLDGIARARRYILVEFYILRGDTLGRSLHAALCRRAAEGVRVHVLFDGYGSHALPRDYVASLRAGGVSVAVFRSTRGLGSRLQINFRNHRKIVVVDGQEGWVGGHNVGDEYLGRDETLSPWRDTHLRLEGPAVAGLQAAFLEDWHWATGTILDLEWETAPAPEGQVAALVLPSGPADPRETCALMFQHLTHSARQRLWIATAYFVPDAGIMAALELAALRGVDVKILIPEHPDHRLVYLSAFAFIGRMLEAGIEVYRYRPGFMHQKVLLVDDRLAGVGTANLDNRSFRLNFEVTALVLDDDFAAGVERMFLDDLSRSERMAPEALEARPWWFKLGARAAYLLAPIL